jgi:tRNA-splicing ligase RtcB
MSRTQAKKEIRGEELQKKMKKYGIYVKSASFSGLAEEAGFAYKDINEVVTALSTADISQPIASFKPLGNIKG